MKLETRITKKGQMYLVRDNVYMPDKYIQKIVVDAINVAQKIKQEQPNEQQP